jgi:hypothetical protein
MHKPKVNNIPHFSDRIFNFLLSCFLKIIIRIRYENIDTKDERNINVRKMNTEILSQLYVPSCVIGKKFLRDSKYNKIITDIITKNVSDKRNLRFKYL